MMEQLGAKDFEERRLRRPGTWVVAYLADWCPFCRAFRPLFAGLDASGRLACAVADLSDTENPLWDDFGINVVPTVIAFRNGDVIGRLDGVAMVGLDAQDLAGFLATLGLPAPRPP